MSNIRRLLPALALVAFGCVTTETPRLVDTDVDTLIGKGDAAFDRRAFDDALASYKLAATVARTEGTEARFVEAASQVAHVLARQGLAKGGRAWLDQAEAAEADLDPAAHTRLLLARGVYAAEDGDAGGALAAFEELYEYCSERDMHVRALQAAHMAAVAAKGGERIVWYRRAVEVGERAGDPRWLAPLWTNLGWLLEEEGHFAEAIVALTRAHEIQYEVGDAGDRMRADWQLGHALRVAGRLDAARGLLERAGAQAEQRYLARRRPNDAEWVGHCQRELGELDAAEGNEELALSRMLTARHSYLEAGIESLAPESLVALDRRISQIRPGGD